MATIIVLFKLKPSVSPERYEAWARSTVLRVGQELNLYNGAREYSQKAIVRWIEKLDDYYFVILDYVKQNNAIEYPYNPESVNNL